MRSKGHFESNYIMNNKEHKVKIHYLYKNNTIGTLEPVMTRINHADFDFKVKAPNFSGQIENH